MNLVVLESTYAVFDPLGGLAVAERVTDAACDAFRLGVLTHGDVTRALEGANESVRATVDGDATLRGAGCTAAASSLRPGLATIAWAGDDLDAGVRALVDTCKANDGKGALFVVLVGGRRKRRGSVGGRMSSEESTHFLNVDLDIKSRANLAPVLSWMDRRAIVLTSERHRGAHFVSIELSTSRQTTPDACIAGLARLIEDLPAAERRLWEGASERTFDVGIQAGSDGQVYRPKIKAATLARVAALDASIVFTVYPYEWGQETTPANLPVKTAGQVPPAPRRRGK